MSKSVLTPVISFKKVSKTFPGVKNKKNEIHAVNSVSLDISDGEIFGIIGYSGAGKSTLIRLINGLEIPTSGSLKVLGERVEKLSEHQLKKLRSQIGMIFQQFNLFNSKTVFGNIEFPLRVAKIDAQKRKERVNDLLEFVGLTSHKNHHPLQLSGGQKQRVGIARALATQPKILLADESTSALDPETTLDVLRLLKRVNKEFGITIVMITHDMKVAKLICDRVAVMENGSIVEVGTAAKIFASPENEVTKKFVSVANADDINSEVLQKLVEKKPEIAKEIQKLFNEAQKSRQKIDMETKFEDKVEE